MKKWLSKIFTALFAVGKDKYMHITFGALIASVALCLFCWLPAWASVLISVLLTLSGALIKDFVIDEKADLSDILCTIIGGIIVWCPFVFYYICA